MELGNAPDVFWCEGSSIPPLRNVVPHHAALKLGQSAMSLMALCFCQRYLPESSPTREEPVGDTATAIGVHHRISEEFECCAPFGLDDLFGLVVRPNKRQITRNLRGGSRAVALGLARIDLFRGMKPHRAVRLTADGQGRSFDGTPRAQQEERTTSGDAKTGR